MNPKLGIGLILATAVVLAAVVALNSSGERPSVPEPDDPPVAKARAVAAPDRSLSAHKLSAINKSGKRTRAVGNEQRVRQRAAALAQDLELSAENEDALLDVLLQEQTRREVAFSDLRSASPDQQAEVRAQVRTELDEILAWKTEELRARFGSDLADTVMRR
jgi:hypothetical protein